MNLTYKDKPKLRDIGPCFEYMDQVRLICLRCGKSAKDSVEGKPCPPNKGGSNGQVRRDRRTANKING